MSGHHSHYRDNYKSQVCHAGCKVIASLEDDIGQVTSNGTVNVSKPSDTGK